MKQAVTILFIIAAIGCSKKESASKFAGTWNGTYSSSLLIISPPEFDSGTVHITVDANNKATGTLESLYANGAAVMKGTVDPSTGTITISEYREGNYGLTIFLRGLTGTLLANSGSGTLTFPWITAATWRATKN